MTNIDSIVNKLAAAYPDARCGLSGARGHELLFAVRLSAQCTDERVNKTTPALFEAFPSLEAFAGAEPAEIEAYIRPCGYYRQKARDIVMCARRLLGEYGGRIPDTLEDLLTLPGVGRKTANLMLGELYGQPGIVADTHCIRLSNRLGLVESPDPARVERELAALIPPREQLSFCHRLILHGRAVCRARGALCGQCVLRDECAAIVNYKGGVKRNMSRGNNSSSMYKQKTI